VGRAAADHSAGGMPSLTGFPHSVIVCTSVHHGNTRRLAEAIASAGGGFIVAPGGDAQSAVREGGLLGLGSGIYFGSHHRTLLAFAESLPTNDAGAAFLFSTSGTGDAWPRAIGIDYHRKLRSILQRKGYAVVGEFSCKGFDTFGPWGKLGGIARGHPDATDLERARVFAASLVHAG
jgi:flavodoxin